MKNRTRWIIPFIILLIVTGYYFFKKSDAKESTSNSILSDVPVTVTTVKKMKISNNFTLVGTTIANNDVNVVAQTQGEVKAVFAEVGDRVSKGALLMILDDEIPRSNLAAAEINYQKARRDFERNETLYQENSISAAQLDAARLAYKSAENQLDVARRQLENTRITSPISGTLNARMVNVGTMVTTGMVVANVVDISTLKVIVNVNENDAFQIKQGNKVEVQTDVYPAKAFEGTIETIAVKADAAHTYRVEIRVANDAKYPLRAGMFARVSFIAMDTTEALVIPRIALIGSIKNAEVFVVNNKTAYLRRIIVGKEAGEMLQVLNGLQEGDTVITTGQNNLSDNMPISIVNNELN